MKFKLRSKSLTCALVGVLTLTVAGAQVARADESSQLRHDLEVASRSQRHALSHAVTSYSYRNSAGAEGRDYLNPTDDRYAAAVQATIQAAVWDDQTPPALADLSDWFGQGLYLARDPLMSANYGVAAGGIDHSTMVGAGWVLTEVELPAKSIIWDLRGEPIIENSLRARLAAQGCRAESYLDLIRADTAEHWQCRPWARAILDAAQVDAIAYDWHEDPAADQVCGRSFGAALYLTRKGPLSGRQVRRLNAALPSGKDAASEDRLAIESFFYTYRVIEAARRWPSLDQDSSTFGLAAWARSHWIGCGSEY